MTTRLRYSAIPRRSNLLFHWDWRDGTDRNGVPVTLRGNAGTFTRASRQWALGADGRYGVVAYGQVARRHEYNAVTGLLEPAGALLEAAGTNSALGSSKFEDGTYWDGQADFTIVAATPPNVFSGPDSAYQHTNLNIIGTRSRAQQIGTFVNGQTDCLSWVLGNTDALTTAISIFDNTAAGHVHRAEFTWASGVLATITGAGTSGVIPLGHGRYRIWLTATGTGSGTGEDGNQRWAFCYVTGLPQNGHTATIHHAQFEANQSFPSSPIRTVGSPASRVTDVLSFPFALPPQEITVYVDLTNFGSGVASAGSRTVFSIGDASSGNRLQVYGASGVGGFRLFYNSNETASTSAPAYGDRVELVAHLKASGNSVLYQSINGAATSNVTAALGALQAAFNAGTLYINSVGTTQVGGAAFHAVKVAAGTQSIDVMRNAV